jgi:hypothetical protein
MPDRETPPDRAPLPRDLLDTCRARFLQVADRLRAVETEIRTELRELAETLGEPPGFEEMCEHQRPMTAWGELYLTATALAEDMDSLGGDCAGFLTGAAAATDESLRAEWEDQERGRR